MSLIAVIEGLAPALLNELESLVLPILGSTDPSAQIAKAKRNLEMDALDAATDAALNAALKKAHS